MQVIISNVALFILPLLQAISPTRWPWWQTAFTCSLILPRWSLPSSQATQPAVVAIAFGGFDSLVHVF